MISVTSEEFAAKIHEYLENVDNQDIEIVREGKRPIILSVPKDKMKQESDKTWVDKYSGIVSLPDNFDEKEFEMNRLWENYYER